MIVRELQFHDDLMRSWWRDRYESGRLYRNTFFQSLEWNQLWSACYVDPHPRRVPVLLGVEREGTLVAVAPLFMQERSFGPLRGWRSIHWIGERLAQYPDLVTDERDATAAWTLLLDYLRERYPDAWIELRDVLPESTASNLRGIEEEDGEPYYRLTLEGLSATSFDAQVQPHMRRELRRARKRLEEDPELLWEFVSSPDETLLGELVALTRIRFGESSWFSEENNRKFFLELCTTARTETWCAVLRRSTRIISILMGYLHGGDMLYVLSGMDEEHRSLSPGTMNLGRTIMHAAEMHLRYYDFLRGDEGYKREFIPETRRSRHLIIIPDRAASRYRLAHSSRRLLDAATRRGVHA